MSLSQVSPGRERINQNAASIPAIGVNGTHGVLNGRGMSGRLRRSTHTPAQTITKASSVPILTSSPRIPIGIRAAKNATKMPTIVVTTIAGKSKVLAFGEAPVERHVLVEVEEIKANDPVEVSHPNGSSQAR